MILFTQHSMDKNLAFAFILAFFFVGLLIWYVFKDTKNIIFKVYPYIIWSLDFALLISTLVY